VLGLVVTDHIYRTFPELPEGELAKVRASVVSAAALAEVAAELDLGKGVLLGKGEDGSGGREKPSILSDALEAVLGAVYLECGWDVVQRLVMDLLGERIAEASIGPGGQDYKTRLQELSAQMFGEVPRYAVTDDGPDHAKRFFAQVKVGGSVRGLGEGRSKKQAEAAAARAAWEALRELVAVDAGAEPRGDDA
jgi:ribonuclease-3